jgi:conjugal transfer pilus assembly protein TraU
MFPIRIGGNIIMNSGSIPDNVNTLNTDDFNPSDNTCSCKNSDDTTSYGIYISFWEPARILEVVQKPNCFPTAFGLNMGQAMNVYGAYGDTGQSPDNSEKAFYNVHYYTFPLLEIMDIITGMDFCTDWLNDIDLMFFTETDPLWNDDELAVNLYPESIIFGNPIAQAICTTDCLAASADYPLNTLFWCAGCWGGLYPFTGNSGVVGSPVRSTSLFASRLLARLARLPVPPAVEYDTSGPAAKCGGEFVPVIKKSQYRFSTIFPIPETVGNCCHTLGSSTFLWGEHRNVPATGEYQIYLMWRKRNCCLKLF